MNDSPTCQVIAFDFDHRVEEVISPEQLATALNDGKQCWINLHLAHAEANSVLNQLSLPLAVTNELLQRQSASRYHSYEGCVHVYVTEPCVVDDSLQFARVDLVFAKNFFLTIRQDEIEFLTAACRSYHLFFRQHAQSLGFVAFECWDGLVDNYQNQFFRLEDRVETIRESISSAKGETIFGQVSDLTRDLLRLRRNVIADRETLQQLAIHKTDLVSSTTQPFLAKMATTMDRLASDAATEREVLTETLNLYLGIVTHRTNQILSRLTLIGVIFLPLTFLVGLYGMNFQSQPEFQWEYGYAFFWCLAAVIVTVSIGFIRYKRWFD